MSIKDKEGFTLVELLAVIAILGVIALIAYPIVTNTLESSKDKLHEEQMSRITEAARSYAVKYGPEDCGCVTVSELQELGYIESGAIKDPKTGATLNGYITIEWQESNNQYSYKYGSSCSCSSGSLLQ